MRLASRPLATTRLRPKTAPAVESATKAGAAGSRSKTGGSLLVSNVWRRFGAHMLFGLVSVGLLAPATPAMCGERETIKGITSLANASVRYTIPERHYVVLRRGPIEAVVVDNAAVDDDVLPGHRAGYHGIASLKHAMRGENVFVPAYSGLNFEHIYDGTAQPRDVLFEPRRAPMELRQIDATTVELYQPPTPNWHVESCLRYTLLPDGAIEMVVECVPRRPVFKRGYMGLFFASYIRQPESKAIHFLGHRRGESGTAWIEATSPRHGFEATHVAENDRRRFLHDDNVSARLLIGDRSRYVYTAPWYFGISHGMALAFVFRPSDQVRFTQSPSGGGEGNPAWDFQYLFQPVETNHLYRIVMRAVYVPYESTEQVARATAPHRRALGTDDADRKQ